MQYSNTTNKDGIIQLAEDYTDLGDGYISGNSTMLKKFTAYANEVSDDIWSVIWSSAGSWQWDDSNQASLPQATTDIVSGRAKYTIPPDILTIKRVEVKNENGGWTKLKPFTREKTATSIGELETRLGCPTHYFVFNDTIQLYPIPSYDLVGGLKVFFDRAGVSFSPSDTTKSPGIASPFHELYPLGMAIKWLSIKQPTNSSLLLYREKYKEKLEAMKEYYARRWEDNAPPVITTTSENFE